MSDTELSCELLCKTCRVKAEKCSKRLPLQHQRGEKMKWTADLIIPA